MKIHSLMASALVCVGVLAANKLHTSCELDKDKLEAFVKCVSLTGQGYKVYVDEFGATTVRRADDQEFDLIGNDSKMRDCMERYGPDVKVELEFNAGDDGQDVRECKDVGAVTSWLAENGAKGMTFVEQPDNAGGNGTVFNELIYCGQKHDHCLHALSGHKENDWTLSYTHQNNQMYILW
jgi:hypothetical protein